MSRPCFALSVMLSFLAFSLLAVEKTHGTDEVISSSHDPSECVVCPLAHGPSSHCADLVCADYSDYDYDYNEYLYEEDPAPLPPPVAETDTVAAGSDEAYAAEHDWYGEDVDGSQAAAQTELATGEATSVENEASPEGDSPNDSGETEDDDFAYYSGYESYEDVSEADSQTDEVAVEAISEEDDSEAVDCFEGYDSYEAFINAEEAAANAADEVTPDTGDIVDANGEWVGGEHGYYEGYDSYEEFVRAGEDEATDGSEATTESGYYGGYDSYEEFMKAGETADEVATESSSYDDSYEDSTEAGEAEASVTEEADLESEWAGGEYGYYEAYDSYEESSEAGEAEADVTADATLESESIDGEYGYYEGYDSYEEFMKAAEETETDEVSGYYQGYDSYEAFMEAAEAEASDIDDVTTADTEEADLQSEWAGEEYGYYGDYEQSINEYEFDASTTAEEADEAAVDEDLETGYDASYDDAMKSDAGDAPTAGEGSATDEIETRDDEYESFYDAYDRLYNFEAQPADDEQAARPLGPVVAEFEAAETTSLEELAAGAIRSVLEDLGTASPIPDDSSDNWDCEVDDWREPVTGSSIILNAAQGLDSAALALQEAADVLRRLAVGESVLVGQAPTAEVTR